MNGDDRLALGAAALGLTLDQAQRDRLARYLALLEKWNRVYNLTAIRSREPMVTRHLLDSLAIAAHVRGPRVLDVGSGAGLPGIPLAVARPELALTLLDANQKKAAFLQQAVVELALPNAAVVAARVESWDTALRFDTIVSRAFADLAELAVASLRLLAPGGVVAAMKGVYPRAELERLPAGVRAAEVIRLAVPGLDAERHLVVMERA